MVAISHYMAACSKGSKMLSFKQTKVDVEVKTTADPEGATSAPIESKAVVNQRVNAASGTGIDGSLLVFPPSSVSTSIRVSMSKGQNLTIPEFATAIGAGSFTSNANTLLISSTPALDLAKPIKITLQLPTIAPSNANWAVLFESKHVSENGQYWSGLIPRSALTMTGTSVTFDASYFGSYQLVSTQTLVDTLVQLKGTVAEIAAGQPPSSPTSIVSISTSAIDGIYASGNVISLLVTFNRPVLVNGAASLALNSGGTADYTGGSGTSALSFSYTVVATHTSTDLDAASVNALTTTGSINDMYGRAAVLTVPVGSTAGALAFNSNIVIAGSAPSVTSVSASTANGSYKAGQIITITVEFSRSVTVEGRPQITLETGTTDQVVDYVSGGGGRTLNFDYTVAAGDTSIDLDYQSVNALALSGGTIKDAVSTISAALTLPTLGGLKSIAGQKYIVIDTTSPVLTFTSSTPSTGSNPNPSVVFNLTEATATNGLRLYSDSGCTTTPVSAATTGTSGSNSVTTTSLTDNSPTTIYGLATDLAGNTSTCTSLLTYKHDNIAPALLTFARTGGASVNALPVSFSVTFSEAISAASFTAGDVSNIGTATGVTWTVTDSGDHTTFTVSATVSGIGTLQPRIAMSGISDPASNVNAANIDSTNAVSYSNATYSVTVNQAAGQTDPINGVPINFTVVFSSAVAGGTFTTGDITQNGTATGITWSLSSGDNITWTLAATAVTGAGTLIPSIGVGLVTDAFGNTNTASTATDTSVTYDSTAPTVTNVSSSLANGSYKINQVVPVKVTFSESVTVTGTPQITLATGGGGDVVNYSSGSPGTVLTFNYTVGSGDTSSDLDYALTTSLALNSSTIKDAAGNNATLTLPAVGDASSIAGQKAIVIDTTDPTITATSVTTTSPGRSQTPGVQFTLNEAATVTLYSDSGCSTTAISSGTSLASGVRTMTTNSLSANVPTTIYGLAADTAGNSSICTTFGSYTNDLTAPGTPTGLTATPTSGQVALSWTASTGSPSGYIVIRHTAAITGGPSDGSDYAVSNAVGNGTVVYANTTNSFTDTGLSNGTTYYYAVRAKDSVLNWSTAAAKSATPSGGGGGGPFPQTVARKADWIYIDWTGGTATYNVNLYSDQSCTQSSVRSMTGLTESKTLFAGLSTSATYYFQISDSHSNQSTCQSISTGTESATELTASIPDTSRDRIKLNFSDPSETATSFDVWQFSGADCMIGGGWKLASAAALGRAGSYISYELHTNAKYSFKIFSGADLSSAKFSPCITGTASHLSEISVFDNNAVVRLTGIGSPPFTFKVYTQTNCSGNEMGSPIGSIDAGALLGIPLPSGTNNNFWFKTTNDQNQSTCDAITRNAATPSFILASYPQTGIVLHWPHGVNSAPPYRLIRYDHNFSNPCSGIGRLLIETSSVQFEDDTVQPSTQYDYRVISKNGGNALTTQSNCLSSTSPGGI